MPKNAPKQGSPEYYHSTPANRKKDERKVVERGKTLTNMEFRASANSDPLMNMVDSGVTKRYTNMVRKEMGKKLNEKYQPAGGVLNRDYHKSEK